MHLIGNVSFVQKDGDHVVLPWPGGAAGQNFSSGNLAETLSTWREGLILEDDAFAARHALTDTG